MAAGVPLEQGHLPAGARQPLRCPQGVPGPWGSRVAAGAGAVCPQGAGGARMEADGRKYLQLHRGPAKPNNGARVRRAATAGGASEGHTGHCSSGTGRKFSWARGVTLPGSGLGLRVGPRSCQRGSGWEWVKRSARWLSCMCRRWGRHQGGSLAPWHVPAAFCLTKALADTHLVPSQSSAVCLSVCLRSCRNLEGHLSCGLVLGSSNKHSLVFSFRLHSAFYH